MMMIEDISIKLLPLISRMMLMTMIVISNNNGNKLSGHEEVGERQAGRDEMTRLDDSGESSDNQSAQIISSHGTGNSREEESHESHVQQILAEPPTRW